MILANYSILNNNPGMKLGGITAPNYWMRGSRIMMLSAPEIYDSVQTEKQALYNGYAAPHAVGLPMKAGSLTVGFNLESIGTASNANLAGGLNAVSTIEGVGQISNAEASLLAFLLATINNSGTFNGNISGGLLALCELTGVGTVVSDLTDGITRVNIVSSIEGGSDITVSITGCKNAVSTINGTSEITASLMALADMIMEITSGGQLSNALSTAKANISANITPFTELSPESLAANVWNSVATEYNRAGSMGSKLNAASSGGVNYDDLSNAVWQALKSGYLDPTQMGGVINILQTKIEELHKIQGLDVDNPATITPTQIAAGSVELQISGNGEDISIITRK